MQHTQQYLMDVWSGRIVMSSSDDDQQNSDDGESDGGWCYEREAEKHQTTVVRHKRPCNSSIDTAAVTARALRAARRAASKFLSVLDIIASDVGQQILHEVSRLSVRRLWICRSVNRAFRALCTAALQRVPRVVVGGQNYCGGGRSSQWLQVIDFSTLRWSTLPALPEPRVEAGMVGLPDGTLVCAGGMVFCETTSWYQTLSVPVLQPGSSWLELPPLSIPRIDGHMVQLHDGRILFLGGTNVGSGSVEYPDIDVADVEVYTMGGDAWGFVAPMLQPRSAFAACVMSNGELIVAGGIFGDGDVATESAEVYNPATDVWSLIPRVPEACREADCGWELQDGRFCVRGRGGKTGSPTRVCYALSHAKNSWEEVWVNESRRGGPTAVPIRGGGCLIAGGMDPENGDSLSTVELWDEESGNSYALPTTMRYALGFTYATTLHVNA